MQIVELSMLLLISFSALFLLSYVPASIMVRRQSENIMITYYLSAGARALLVLMFIVLGAQEELLIGIAFGVTFEIFKMFRFVRKIEAREVLA